MARHAVQIERPSTWVPYKKGMCEGCYSGCCTLPVETSATDLIRLELTTEDELAVSTKRVAKRLQKEGLIQSYRAETGIFILAQKYGHDCIYLGADRRCTVYEKRPLVCREFPKIGPRPGLCPKQDKKDRFAGERG